MLFVLIVVGLIVLRKPELSGWTLVAAGLVLALIPAILWLAFFWQPLSGAAAGGDEGWTWCCRAMGYPGIGGEMTTFTKGVVSDFTCERGVEGRAFIKTDATIAGGNSGGLVANQQGESVGVPTQVGYDGA